MLFVLSLREKIIGLVRAENRLGLSVGTQIMFDVLFHYVIACYYVIHADSLV